MNLFHYNIHIHRSASGENGMHTQDGQKTLLTFLVVMSSHVLHGLNSCVNFLSIYCVNNGSWDAFILWVVFDDNLLESLNVSVCKLCNPISQNTINFMINWSMKTHILSISRSLSHYTWLWAHILENLFFSSFNYLVLYIIWWWCIFIPIKLIIFVDLHFHDFQPNWILHFVIGLPIQHLLQHFLMSYSMFAYQDHHQIDAPMTSTTDLTKKKENRI